jgi:hypothetical protein
MDKAVFKQEATKWRDWFQKGQKYWSIAHHATVFGSIFCSVTAGALLQLKGSELNGLAAVLTTIAAALTSLAAAGGFERKWRSNRLSRSRIDGLLIDITADTPNIPDLTNQLKDIIVKHDREIIGEETKESMEGKEGLKSGSNLPISGPPASSP